MDKDKEINGINDTIDDDDIDYDAEEEEYQKVMSKHRRRFETVEEYEKYLEEYEKLRKNWPPQGYPFHKPIEEQECEPVDSSEKYFVMRATYIPETEPNKDPITVRFDFHWDYTFDMLNEELGQRFEFALKSRPFELEYDRGKIIPDSSFFEDLKRETASAGRHLIVCLIVPRPLPV